MIREETEEKEKEAGRGWLEIREMKARHLTMICLSANWSTTSISNKKKKKKKNRQIN